MSSYFIGVDIGTTSTKAIAFSSEGHIISHHNIGYPISHPEPEQSEQDPDEILKAVIETIQQVQKEARTQGTLEGLSFSAAMHSLMAVDVQGKPLTQLIIWADNRAGAVADKLKLSPEGMEIYQATGTPIHAMSPLCKLLWLREHNPDLFKQAHKFIGIKEYVFFRLFGKYVIDHSLASATGLFDIHTLDWNKQALQKIQLPVDKLSTLVDIFHVEHCSSEWAERLTIPDQTPFVIGASDGCLANVGTGAVTPDQVSITVGTSGAVRIGIPKPWTDSKMQTFCYVLTPELFIAGGGMNNGGIIAEWLHNNLFPELEQGDFATLITKALSVPAGSDGLLFLPYLLGERAPVYNAHAKGVYFGITIQHTQAHFIRAAFEGIALAIYHTGRALLDQFPEINTLYVGGGFARSKEWVQLLADVYGKPIAITDTVESSGYGAVLVGRYALKTLKAWRLVPVDKSSQVFEPNSSNHQLYQQVFDLYCKLYNTLSPQFFS
ncbi:gluconokinase [Xanthocytophaga agilis]|uniref:Gluconokinase n=1 Tax=Xanthocytophaga agilis TaxID=3048010 RepID=A0AAE3R757_9BACT|nr:gluconokinase [Xanthocytophaga agilis]MDJ1502675.1 gluconokinase [Xanthocytophaga agilis]